MAAAPTSENEMATPNSDSAILIPAGDSLILDNPSDKIQLWIKEFSSVYYSDPISLESDDANISIHVGH